MKAYLYFRLADGKFFYSLYYRENSWNPDGEECRGEYTISLEGAKVDDEEGSIEYKGCLHDLQTTQGENPVPYIWHDGKKVYFQVNENNAAKSPVTHVGTDRVAGLNWDKQKDRKKHKKEKSQGR